MCVAQGDIRAKISSILALPVKNESFCTYISTMATEQLKHLKWILSNPYNGRKSYTRTESEILSDYLIPIIENGWLDCLIALKESCPKNLFNDLVIIQNNNAPKFRVKSILPEIIRSGSYRLFSYVAESVMFKTSDVKLIVENGRIDFLKLALKYYKLRYYPMKAFIIRFRHVDQSNNLKLSVMCVLINTYYKIHHKDNSDQIIKSIKSNIAKKVRTKATINSLLSDKFGVFKGVTFDIIARL
jgi:hypothetical protein